MTLFSPKHPKRLAFFALLLAMPMLAVVFGPALAQPEAPPEDFAPLVILEGQGVVPLASHLLALNDPEGVLTLPDVLEHPNFAHRDRTKLRSGTIWYKTTLTRAPSVPEDWVLAFGEPDMGDVQVYVVGADGSVRETHLGRNLATRALDWAGLQHMAGVTIPTHEEVTLVLRLSSDHKIRFEAAALWLPQALLLNEARGAGTLGIIVGALSIIILLYGLFGTWMKNGAMVAYALYVATLLSGRLAHSGFGPLMILDMTEAELTILRRLFFLGGAAAFTLMWSFILDLRRQSPWIYRIYLLIAAVLVVMIPLLPTAQTGLAVRLSQAVMLGISLSSVGICLLRLRRGPRDIFLILYCIAFTPVIPTWFAMVTTPLLPIVPEAAGRFLHHVSVPFHVSLLAFALAFQLRQTSRAKAEAEKALAGERIARERLLTFVEMANHEFKTPLATIDAAAQNIDLRARKGWTDFTAQVDVIQRAVKRLTLLVQTCLSVERDVPTALKRRRVSPEDLMAQVARLHLADSPDQLDISTKTLPQTCVLDPDLILIALEALIDNARRFGPNDQTITVTAQATDTELTLCVADRGPGVTKGEENAIFEKYYRSAATSSVPGTGVGLFLVKTIAELHGGHVHYAPRQGGGGVFSLTLPLDQREL